MNFKCLCIFGKEIDFTNFAVISFPSLICIFGIESWVLQKDAQRSSVFLSAHLVRLLETDKMANSFLQILVVQRLLDDHDRVYILLRVLRVCRFSDQQGSKNSGW